MNKLDRKDIIKCCHLVNTAVQIRLFNTKADDAHYPAVLRNVNIDVNGTLRMLKQLYDADRTKLKIKVYDTLNGDKRLNKKTVVVFPVKDLPQALIHAIEKATVTAIPTAKDIEF